MLISAAGKLSVTKTRDNHPVKRSSFLEPRGFTMVETAIVILIISIVIAMATPRLIKSSGSLPLKTASKKLGAALRYSRSQAINSGSTYNTIFNTEENKIIVLQVPVPSVSVPTGTFTEDEELQEIMILKKFSVQRFLAIFCGSDAIFVRKLQLCQNRKPEII